MKGELYSCIQIFKPEKLEKIVVTRMGFSTNGLTYEDISIQPVVEPIFINRSLLYLSQNRNTLITINLPFKDKM